MCAVPGRSVIELAWCRKLLAAVTTGVACPRGCIPNRSPTAVVLAAEVRPGQLRLLTCGLSRRGPGGMRPH